MILRLFFIFSICIVSNGLLAQNDDNEYLPLDLDSIESYLQHINRKQIKKIEGKFS